MSDHHWYETIPFICPTRIAEARDQRQAVVVEEPLTVGAAEMRSSRGNYPIVDGVPFLLPRESAGAEDVDRRSREEFYGEHYARRNREADLATDYLAKERVFVRDFIERRGLDGLVFEIGCGTGIFADCSPNYLGMDYSATSVFTPGFEPYRRFVGNAQAIPLAAGAAQVVFSFNTLEHVPRVDQAFEEIDRILAPAGYALLHPAWNCTSIQTRLIPVLPYSRLGWGDRLTKAMLPVLRSSALKAAVRIVYRLRRWLGTRAGRQAPLRYRALQPYLGTEFFIADCDATASIDVYDGILFFLQRGYRCLSHPRLWDQLSARHAVVILQKPPTHPPGPAKIHHE